MTFSTLWITKGDIRHIVTDSRSPHSLGQFKSFSVFHRVL